MKLHGLLIASLMLAGSAVFAQGVPTNRYAMKLQQNPDGTYSLQKENNYRKIVDLDAIPDLYTPYVHQNDRLTSKLYKETETEVLVYKNADGRELKIAVDKAKGNKPAPVMFYCHGGGWSRGDFESGRSLSKYMAQQHGITGVRIEYSLAQPGVKAEVSAQDVIDAVAFVRGKAKELNIDPGRIGLQGTSAGGHLAAHAAMKIKGVKLFVGYSGIYDLTTAALIIRTRDQERIDYFYDLDQAMLRKLSPRYLIPKKTGMAVQLYCGTADIVVECSQSKDFAEDLKKHGASVDLQVYENYDHNLSSKASDKMEEIFFKTAEFIAANL